MATVVPALGNVDRDVAERNIDQIQRELHSEALRICSEKWGTIQVQQCPLSASVSTGQESRLVASSHEEFRPEQHSR